MTSRSVHRRKFGWLPFAGRTREAFPEWTRKEDAPCCQARRDELGRYPVGWCGPDCVRRAERKGGRA